MSPIDGFFAIGNVLGESFRVAAPIFTASFLVGFVVWSLMYPRYVPERGIPYKIFGIALVCSLIRVLLHFQI